MAICCNKIFILPLCASLLLLGGCMDLYEEGHLTQNRLVVEQEEFSDQISVAEANEHYIANLAHNYRRFGSGPIELNVTYDPHSKDSSAMKAGNSAARIAKALRNKGIENVTPKVLPVNDQGEDSQLLVSFNSYRAGPPDDCDTMPGFESTDADNKTNPNYKLGCTVENVFARQIARPKDLAGDAQLSAGSEGRGASNVIELYRTGAPNEPLEGQSASDTD